MNATEISTSHPSTTIESLAPFLPTADSVVMEKTALSSLVMQSVKPCTLMGLPVEVRRKILGHLLPNAQEIRVADTEPLHTKENWLMLRPRYEACHTAVLRANRQLYTEGTAVLYNRAFRVMVTHTGVVFLKSGYSLIEINEPMSTRSFYEMRDNRLSTFAFHKVKQLQIQLWATDCRYNLFDLRAVIINLCSILYGQPSLKNVRVDLYDSGYKPQEFDSYDDYYDLLFDDDEPHPAQDKHPGQMLIYNKESGFYNKESGFWIGMRWSGISTRSHNIPSRTTDLELILQPLKLLRGVVRARINLTAEAEKDEDVRRIAKECQDAMMSSGPRDDSEVKFVDWCTEWGAENVLWNEWGTENVLPDGRPYLLTSQGPVVKHCYYVVDPYPLLSLKFER